MAYRFHMPSVNLMGKDCIKEVGPEVKKLGFKKALIVTDKDLVGCGLIKTLTDVLDADGIQYAIYDKVVPNPTTKNVHDGLDMLNAEGCDFVISFGGGSVHDACKGIALVKTNGGNIRDYEGVNKSAKPQLPMIAINTTAGTASEMTIFCIITNEDNHIKMALVDVHMTPILAVNDPMIMVNMPKGLTAATGMDALTHAIEAFVSIVATPVTDACAEKAVELIFGYLKKAVDNGQDLEARDMMAYAEFLAGMAFNNAILGYVHAMAHQLGGFYDLPHGVCNAILLPHVQEFNAGKAADRLIIIGKYMGIDIANLSDADGAKATIDAIKALSKSIGIPSGLKELGVKEEDFTTLATNARKDACASTNPREASLEDVIQIFKNAM